MNQYIKSILSICAVYLILISVVATSINAQSAVALSCNDRAGCDTISLSRSDVDRLWQGLYGGNTPVTFQSVNGGVLTGLTSDINKIVTTDKDGEMVHDQQISTDEFFWAGNPLSDQDCIGPFSIGVHITKDVRVAQCLSKTTAEGKENCEGVYGDNDLLAEFRSRVGAAPDYTKKNTLLNASFNSNMLCASGNNCNFIIFSEFEKTFNFTVSMVDVVTIVAPLAGKVATTKILGGKSVLERLKVVGKDSWTSEIPILKTIVKKSYPNAYKDEVKDMVEARFKADASLRARFGDDGYKRLKGVKDIDDALDEINKGMTAQGLNQTDTYAKIQLEGLRIDVAKKELYMAQAGGGFYNKNINRYVSEDDYAKAIAPDAKDADTLKAVYNLYDDAALKKAVQAEPAGNLGTFTKVMKKGGKTEPSSLKLFDDKTTEQMAKYRWQTDSQIGGDTTRTWEQATKIQKEIYKKAAIKEQKDVVLKGGSFEFVTDQGATIKLDNISKDAAKNFRNKIVKKDFLTTSANGPKLILEPGGKIPALPKTWSEKYFPSAADQASVGKAYAAKFGKFTGDYGYALILKPVGRNILRTGGGAIGLPVSSFAAYRVPANWSTVYMKPGREHQIYDDAYIDILYNRKDDPKNPLSTNGLGNGNLLQRYMTVLAKLPANLPVVGSGVQTWIDDQERTDHVGDGQVYVTSLPYGSVEDEAAFSNQDGVFAINNGRTSFSANALRMYTLELPSKEDKKLGPVVATYAHHTDLSMRMSAGENGLSEGAINIGEAVDNKEGCSDNPLTYNLLEKTGAMGEGTKLNLSAATIITAFNNNMWPIVGTSFVASGPAGIAALVPTLIGQWIINEYVIGDCIDTTGGYFVTGHLAPGDEASDMGSIASDLASSGQSLLNPTNQSDVLPTPDILKGIDTNVASMLGEAAGSHPRILEMQVNTKTAKTKEGAIIHPSGNLQIEGLFSLWTHGTCVQSSMPETASITTLVNEDGTNALIKKGPNSANVCIRRPDGTEICMLNDNEAAGEKSALANMTSLDTTIPAYGIPQKVRRISWNATMKIDPSQKTIQVSDSLFNCIKDYASCVGYKTDGLSSADITPLTGWVQTIHTDDGYTINLSENSLIVNGTGPNKLIGEAGAYITINTDSTISVNSGGKTYKYGKFMSIVTTNGLFMRESRASNNILFWIRTVATAQQTSVNNAISSLAYEDCDEEEIFAGFNFNFKAQPNNPRSANEIAALNTAAIAYGPFKVIESDKKIYYFFADKDCNPILKVFDKDTGKFEEYKLNNVTRVAEDTYKLDTDKGEQTLQFDNKNGKEYAKWNDGPWELLEKLIGRNGTLTFDPTTAMWKALNEQLLPLADAFKELGMAIGAKNGQITGEPGGNIMIYNPPAADDNFFQLPWYPETKGLALLFTTALLGVILIIRKFSRKLLN